MIDIRGVNLEKIILISFILIIYMFLIIKIKNLLKSKVNNIKKR